MEFETKKFKRYRKHKTKKGYKPRINYSLTPKYNKTKLSHTVRLHFDNIGLMSTTLNLRDQVSFCQDFQGIRLMYSMVHVYKWKLKVIPYAYFGGSLHSAIPPVLAFNDNRQSSSTMNVGIDCARKMWIRVNETAHTATFKSLDIENTPQPFDTFQSDANRLGWLHFVTDGTIGPVSIDIADIVLTFYLKTTNRV